MSHDLKPWKTLNTREIFIVPGRVTVATHTVELPGGQIYEPYYRVDLADQAWVAATTEDGRFVCQRQYKHGPGRVTVTLPGGIVDPGESPEETAQRELLEETGYTCGALTHLGSFCRNNNQRCGEEHFFWATGAVWEQDPDPSTNLEEIETVLLTRDELAGAVQGGDVGILGQMAGILLALRQAGSPPGP